MRTLALACISQGSSPLHDSRQRRGALGEPGGPRVFVARGVGQLVSIADAGVDAALSLQGHGGHDALWNTNKNTFEDITCL